MSCPATQILSGFARGEAHVSIGTDVPLHDTSVTCTPRIYHNRTGAESRSTTILRWGAVSFTVLSILWAFVIRIFSRRHCAMRGAPSGPTTNHYENPDLQVLDEIMQQPLLSPGGQPLAFHATAISPSLVLSAATSRHSPLPMPERDWNVLSSWDIRCPTRVDIPRAFQDERREEPDLLHIEAYKLSMERKQMAFSEQVLAAQKHLNQCESDEGILLLGVRNLAPDSYKLTSGVALTVARAARRSLEARIKLCETRLAYAQLEVQNELDCLEEARVAMGEANHQMFPIVSAFLEKGWHLSELPIYLVQGPGAVFPSPPSLSQITSMPSDKHPYLPTRTISRQAVSSLEQSSQSGSDERASCSS